MLVLRGFSAGDACFCQCLLMMLAVSGVAGDAGSADDAGFCWCLDLLLMFVLGGCSDDIVVQKNEKCTSTKKTLTHSKNTLEYTNCGPNPSKRKPWGKFWASEAYK
jgi:hypothetical protein